jgi:hypothetical protein
MLKSFGLLLVCLILLTIAGVAYYVAHNPLVTMPAPQGAICTMEAKLCPDGSYVGRGGPRCEFAVCPTAPATWRTYHQPEQGWEVKYPPVLEVYPTAPGGNLTSFQSASFYNNEEKDLDNEHAVDIAISKISNSSDGFPQQLINATVYDGSGLHPKSFDEFTSVTINGNENFYYLRTGVFESVLSLVYYYPTNKGIYAFNLVARGVDWTNPNYNPDTDPAHLILKQMLPTFKLVN